jgi:N-acetyl-D-muramate 6-phosphate phosphatase
MTSLHGRLRALLLDLDGTLADTAADLGGALNRLRAEEGLPPLPAERIRPIASDGSRALLRLGFGLEREDARFPAMQRRFLDHYAANVATETRPFRGMDNVLAELAGAGLPWGIVTNKPGWLTTPLIDALAFASPPACVVCGDTVDRAKPHPDPLLHAAELIGQAPGECLYVGDAPRDIEAAHAAGMPSVVAGWGYLPADSDPAEWRALTILESPEALGRWIMDRIGERGNRHAG